jgi:serine protease Do
MANKTLMTVAGALGLLIGPAAGATVTPRTAAPAEARALSRAFSSSARAIGPSVVRIEARAATDVAGRALAPIEVSGLIIDTAGNIVTLGEAVERATAVTVVLSDSRTFSARVLGTDPRIGGVGLIRLDQPPADLAAARFGDSDLAEVGEWTLAIGRPAGLDQAVSAGIIGGRWRAPILSSASAPEGSGYFQTDATVAGSAGGPLVDLDGQVIGLCANGFAIPINQVRRAAQMIARDGRAHYPFIGVALRDVEDLDSGQRERLGPSAPAHGALVSQIWNGAPAARAGLRAGDVITTVDNQETPAAEDVIHRLSYHAVGEQLTVGFVRNGRARSVRVSLDDLPSPSPARRAPDRPSARREQLF